MSTGLSSNRHDKIPDRDAPLNRVQDELTVQISRTRKLAGSSNVAPESQIIDANHRDSEVGDVRGADHDRTRIGVEGNPNPVTPTGEIP